MSESSEGEHTVFTVHTDNKLAFQAVMVFVGGTACTWRLAGHNGQFAFLHHFLNGPKLENAQKRLQNRMSDEHKKSA